MYIIHTWNVLSTMPGTGYMSSMMWLLFFKIKAGTKRWPGPFPAVESSVQFLIGSLSTGRQMDSLEGRLLCAQEDSGVVDGPPQHSAWGLARV